MNASEVRLLDLAHAVGREAVYLQETDARLFAQAFDMERVVALPQNPLEGERVDAFAMRFSRLQDTLGDKLLPALLSFVAEPVGAAVDNLDRAERLGWLESADVWMAVRKLRNYLTHEYEKRPDLLLEALLRTHAAVPALCRTAQVLATEVRRRVSPPAR